MMMRLQALFVAHTRIQIPKLHEMCREPKNPHIGTVTSNLTLQIVFVSSVFHDVFFTLSLFWKPIR